MAGRECIAGPGFQKFPTPMSGAGCAGRLASHHGRLLANAFQTVALLGTPAVGVRTLTSDVLDAAYRPAFARTAADLTRTSAEAPTDALFELLLEQGRAMRTQTNRDALAAGTSQA